MEFGALLEIVRGALIADPFLIQGGQFPSGIKHTTVVAPQHAILSVKGWKKLEMFLEDKYAGRHIRISDGKSSRLLLAPRYAEVR